MQYSWICRRLIHDELNHKHKLHSQTMRLMGPEIDRCICFLFNSLRIITRCGVLRADESANAEKSGFLMITPRSELLNSVLIQSFSVLAQHIDQHFDHAEFASFSSDRKTGLRI